MRKVTLNIIAAIFFVFASGVLSGQTFFGIVPAGGECLVDEESCAITWTNSNTFTTNADVLLWNGTSCSWTAIATSVSSTTYQWDIDVDSYGDRFRIKAVNSNDEDDYAFSTGYFSIVEPPDEFIGVEEATVKEDPELQLYPNPATNVLNIKLENHRISSVYFWDMSGRLIYHLNNVNSQFCKTSLADFPRTGEFFVECYSTNNRRFIRKLVIRR